MASRLPGLWVLVIASIVLACSDLKHADQTPDGGPAGDSGPSATDDGGPPDSALADGAVPDAGTPPADFECAGDAWTKPTKTKPECAARQVRVVEPGAPADPTGVSIARTPAGRVGIVYNDEVDGQTGEMHLAHFTPATATYAAAKIVKRATGFAFHDGYRTKLAASAPDTLAVLAYDMDDNTGPPRTGGVHLRKLVAGAEPLTDNTDDIVATAVADPTEIAVASDPSGTIYATVRISTPPKAAKLAAKTKTPTGAFTALPDVVSGLLVDATDVNAAPNAGATSLVVDPGGQLHLLFLQNQFTFSSTPRYHELAGTTWSSQKTIDNAVLDGISGYSPRLAIFGTKKYAAFFFRKAQQSNPVTADLRLASWDAATDTPVIEILDQTIPSGTVAAPAYAFRVAMAVDKYGLVHIALIRPTSATAGYLAYRRQTRDAGGSTKWLEDIVDPDVLSDLSEAFVDMVVDENARPHIAYRSATDGLVKYATRFDR